MNAKFNHIIEPAKLEKILPVALNGQIIDIKTTKKETKMTNSFLEDNNFTELTILETK